MKYWILFTKWVHDYHIEELIIVPPFWFVFISFLFCIFNEKYDDLKTEIVAWKIFYCRYCTYNSCQETYKKCSKPVLLVSIRVSIPTASAAEWNRSKTILWSPIRHRDVQDAAWWLSFFPGLMMRAHFPLGHWNRILWTWNIWRPSRGKPVPKNIDPCCHRSRFRSGPNSRWCNYCSFTSTRILNWYMSSRCESVVLSEKADELVLLPLGDNFLAY